MSDTAAILQSHYSADRREQRREKVGNESAYIDLDDGRGPVTCRIWDISASGARILVPPDVLLPHSFRIYVKHNWRAANAMWRQDWQVGVCFLP